MWNVCVTGKCSVCTAAADDAGGGGGGADSRVADPLHRHRYVIPDNVTA